MANTLRTCQTLDGETMRRLRDDHEAGPKRGGHPIFAALYDPIGASMERRWMGGRRRRLLAGARGAVLEIGGGTGANLTHYRGVDARPLHGPGSGVRIRRSQAHLASWRTAAVYRARPRRGVYGPLAGSSGAPLGAAPRRLPSQSRHRPGY